MASSSIRPYYDLSRFLPADVGASTAASAVNTALAVFGGIILLSSSAFLYRWRNVAKQKLEDVTEKIGPILAMKRVKLTDEERRKLRSTGSLSDDTGQMEIPYMARNLDLTEEYVEKMRGEGMELMSLGEYLASLRPAGPTKVISAKDIEVLIGSALLRVLGPAIGMTLLPVLGLIQGKLDTAATSLGGVANAASEVGHGAETQSKSKGKKGKTMGETLSVDSTSAIVSAVGGVSLLAMSGAADLNAAIAQARSQPESDGSNTSTSELGPLEIMRRGETSAKTFPTSVIPNPFVMSKHWDAAIKAMEELIAAEKGDDSYEPNENLVYYPSPLREMLLPDLHIGLGFVRCTHSNHDVLEMRLLAILLNKLSTIDILDEVHDENGTCPASPFVVRMEPNSNAIFRPDDFRKALIDSGHTIDGTVTTRLTTFGLRLSVKDVTKDEETGDKTTNWINIPLAFDLRTGIQHPETGRNVGSFLTHGGIDLNVSGPLICNAKIQYYHNQGGFDGWATGEYPVADWAERPVLSRKIDDPVRAVRLAGFLACCENSVGSRFRLPVGGYGSTGVCTDSAAIVEYALTGHTNVYPLLGIGSYKGHVKRRANEFHKKATNTSSSSSSSSSSSGVKYDVPPPLIEDIAAIRHALHNAPNDVHPLPSTERDAARRILASCVRENDPPFQLMVEELEVLKAIASSS